MAKWRFGNWLGAGGFCEVLEARLVDEGTGETRGPVHAVKRVKQPFTSDQEVVRRFQREVRLLADTLRHPNIIAVTGRNLSDMPPWFVMPKLDGNLRDALDEGRAGDTQWVIEIFRQILGALAYAHGQNIIHRDLKPKNVLMDEDAPLLSDFGLGKDLSSNSTEVTRTSQWSGTEPYMAPEQFDAMKTTDYRADVFSLGKLLYEMLTGEAPPVGSINGEDLPEPFRYFVARCCDAKAENRYRDSAEALEAFDRVTDAGGEEPASAKLNALVEEWWDTPTGADIEVVQRIHELLSQHEDDEQLFTREVPRLPQDLLHQYQDDQPELFLSMLERYDRHVSGGLPFSYCDVVARFYSDIWERSSNLRLRKLVLRRLINMGASHNRFFVRDVVSDILADVEDVSSAEMAREVIKEDPQHAQWFASRVLRTNPPRPISEAFSSL